MDLVILIETIVKQLVKDSESVLVKELNSENEKMIQIIVSSSDMGFVIGKNGKLITAIRSIVHASAAKNGLPMPKINVDCI